MRLPKSIQVSALLLIGGFALWKGYHPTHVPSKPSTIIPDRSELSIDTPQLAQRKERKLRLSNGLEALLISDSSTPQSGAALAVSVGSWQDPPDALGMAHFVEHLLFLGTEKYPEEESLSRYLSEHGGKHNACTMNDRTIYMFAVNNEGFSGALDRLGQFFLAPRFTPSSIERERHAIHQEFCKDMALDQWRISFVSKELANSQHPLHQFCIGNEETLGALSHEAIKEWFDTYYSVDRMHLVVYSAKDLDALEEEVATIFGPIARHHTITPPTEPLFTPSDAVYLAAIEPLQPVQTLELNWELPPALGRDLEHHSDQLVGYILGHEGATSLLANLKKEKWAESLRAGGNLMGNDQALFTLSIQLTAEGVRHYERVIQRIFEAIASLRETGVPHYIYDEMVTMEERKYRFQSRGDIFEGVMEQAIQMVDEPLDTFPRKTLLPSAYNEANLTALLQQLTPEQCQFLLIADPQLSSLTPTLKEKWLQAAYTLHQIPAETVAAWRAATPHAEITIPPPNPFICQTLPIKQEIPKRHDALPLPTLSVNAPLGKLYTCEDDRFLVPKISWTFTLNIPQLAASLPLHSATADLFCLIINENIAAMAYQAKLAGLAHSLKATPHGIEVTVNGYEEKAHDFLALLLDAITHFPTLTAEDFVLYRDQLQREYANRVNSSPLKQGTEQLWAILYKAYASLPERMDALDSLSLETVKDFAASLTNTLFVEGMLYGSREAAPVWSLFEKAFALSQPLASDQQPHFELATLAKEGFPSSLSIPSALPAHALILTLECPDFSFPRYAAQEILSKGLEEPFFSELRTRQQTAYLVTHWSQEVERHLYSFFAIQSSSHNSDDLLARFETFLANSMARLEEEVIPRARFEMIRAALIHRLEDPVATLPKMGELLHTLARDYDGAFTWLEQRKEALRALTYEAFLAYAREAFGENNRARFALCIEGPLPSPTTHTDTSALPYEKVTSAEVLRQRMHYTQRREHDGV